MSDTVALIAKGPSAENAREWINAFEHIATINDSGRYVEGPIQWAFFTDTIRPIETQRHRVERFVSPDVRLNLPEWYRPEIHIRYADTRCGGSEDEFRERVYSGGICHHHTTTGAMHWLAKIAKYKRIRIIGVDGGHSYAADSHVNLETHNRLKTELGENFLDDWKVVTHRLAKVLAEVYGTEFEWFNE